MRFFKKGQNKFGAWVTGTDPPEIGAVCAGGAVVGCDLHVEKGVSNGQNNRKATREVVVMLRHRGTRNGREGLTGFVDKDLRIRSNDMVRSGYCSARLRSMSKTIVSHHVGIRPTLKFAEEAV